MAKRIAAMLISKNNSQSYPSNMAAGSMQGCRSKSNYDIPDSPFISSNNEYPLRSSSSCYLRTREMEITKTISLRSLTSVTSLKRDLEAGKLIKAKPKPGEPILVSAKPRASHSGSLNGIRQSFDANKKEPLFTRSEVNNSAVIISTIIPDYVLWMILKQ